MARPFAALERAAALPYVTSKHDFADAPTDGTAA
jgi:hypothetical protein